MTDPTSSLRRRTNDPQGLRRRVLDTAASLFQTQGYANTAMQDIARAAGVTGGGLHHHFPTKRSVALAVVRERVRDAVIETWIRPVRDAPTVKAGVSRVLRQIHDDLAAAGRVNGCPLNNLTLELSSADAEIRAALREVFDEWRLALTQKVQADQGRGELTGLTPDHIATLIVAAYSGAMAIAKVEQHPKALEVCRVELAARLAA